ncbi:hypothetical protein [Lentibacter sp.]|uniref:hypothetical protein n=1 Tax=Lentibacter sp. TaxID=2024994 RepID=UPI003F6CB5C7
MSHKFIAAIAATAVAISMMGANPSFAGNRDRDKALLGLAGIVMLGVAISEASKNDRRYAHQPQRAQPVKPRPLPQNLRKKMLPRECLRTVNTRGQSTRFLGRGCLQNKYRWVGQLPRACSVKLWTNRGQRFGYAPACLRQHGYRLNG